jgi:hypothetical protein
MNARQKQAAKVSLMRARHPLGVVAILPGHGYAYQQCSVCGGVSNRFNADGSPTNTLTVEKDGHEHGPVATCPFCALVGLPYTARRLNKMGRKMLAHRYVTT